MKKVLFVNSAIIGTGKLILILFVILNSTLLNSLTFSSLGSTQNELQELYHQALNPVTEYAGIKINIKPLAESFTDKFYSYEFCIKSLAQLPKSFIIISETDSEINIRQLTFLYTQTSTST